MANIKPIFLFSDSQLLFWKDKNKSFLSRILEYVDKDKKKENIKAAYIGASNGDNPDYFDIFKAAMDQIGVTKCRMIPSKPDIVDLDFLNLSEIILLAGGEVKKGWDIFKQNNLDKIIMDSYHKGAVLMGLSAGAVQLGLKGKDDSRKNSRVFFDTFKIIPYIIDVHNENDEWKQLHKMVKNGEQYLKGYGIPSGGGMIFYPDWSIEAIRYILTELELENEKDIKQSMILPLKDEL